jgi:NHLM bacteriocin system ABC transporter ATP-binding protein
MTVAPQIASQLLNAASGERIAIRESEVGFVVEQGCVELFLINERDNRPASQRHFLFEVKAGGIVMPLLEFPPGLRVLLIASEPAVLRPISAAALVHLAQSVDLRPRLAATLDQWIGLLSRAAAAVVGPVPSGAQAMSAGDQLTCVDGSTMTVRANVGWIVGTATDLSYCGSQVSSNAETPAIALAPGTWITAGSAGTVKSITTTEILALPDWRRAMCRFHVLALTALQGYIESTSARIERDAEQRRHGNNRLAARAIDSFHDVAKSQRAAWRGRADESERVLAAFLIVAQAVGLDLPQRAREQIRKAKTVDEAIRSARLRQRQVALRGQWWREDLGPLIGFIDAERRPVAMLPARAGSWQLIDPAHGSVTVITDAVAARIAPLAHMLYPVLTDKPHTFVEFFRFGEGRNRHDLIIAVLTAMAGAALSLVTPLAMRLAFSRFIPAHDSFALSQLALGLVLAAMVALAFRVAYNRASLRIEGRSGGNFPAALMDRVLRLPEAALRFGSADLALRFAAADNVRRSVNNIILTSIPAVFLCVCNGALLFYYAPAAAAVALSVFILLGGLSAVFAWLQRDAMRRGEQLHSDIFNIVFQLIQAMTVLRTTGAEVRAFSHWGVDFAELRKRSHVARKIGIVFETLLGGIDVLVLAGMFLLLAWMPDDRHLSTGDFIAFVWAYGVFAGNAMQLVRNVGAAFSLRTSWERAAPLLRAVPRQTTLQRDPGPLSGAIDVTNLAFRYSDDLPLALAGVSMNIPAGAFVAIVGPSGSGKSTLMRQLLALDRPLQGTIEYDGQDLRHLDPELVRRQIGVVLQGGRLFPGTLYENIMGSFNGKLDDAWRAAEQAGIAAEIRALPMGMHTVVTEATAAFSGGQVQRFVIARALVGKPRILVFDEATSALDNLTQAVVTESLSRLAITRIVIAHRLSTVRNADKIYVLDRGRIVQSGNYDELANAKGPFAGFVRRQQV